MIYSVLLERTRNGCRAARGLSTMYSICVEMNTNQKHMPIKYHLRAFCWEWVRWLMYYPCFGLFWDPIDFSVHRLRWLPVGTRQEVKAPEPNRNEVWVLVALFGGSIRLKKKSQPKRKKMRCPGWPSIGHSPKSHISDNWSSAWDTRTELFICGFSLSNHNPLESQLPTQL